MNENLKALLALCSEALRSGLRRVKEDALQLAKESRSAYFNRRSPEFPYGGFSLGDDRTIDACIDTLEADLL